MCQTKSTEHPFKRACNLSYFCPPLRKLPDHGFELLDLLLLLTEGLLLLLNRPLLFLHRLGEDGDQRDDVQCLRLDLAVAGQRVLRPIYPHLISR
jgi:hypothetical protein